MTDSNATRAMANALVLGLDAPVAAPTASAASILSALAAYHYVLVDARLIKPMVDGWYGDGVNGETWDAAMSYLRAATTHEPER